MVTTPKNDTDARAMRDALANYDREQAKIAHDETVARFKPLSDLVGSKEFAKVLDGITAAAGNYRGDSQVDGHLQYLPGALANLKTGVEAITAAPPILAVPAEATPAA